MELSLNDGAPLSVIRHALPYFIPVDQLAAEFCTDASETACQRFVWAIYRYLHAFVARRQEAIFAKVSCTCQTVALPKFCINPCTWDLLYVLLRYWYGSFALCVMCYDVPSITYLPCMLIWFIELCIFRQILRTYMQTVKGIRKVVTSWNALSYFFCWNCCHVVLSLDDFMSMPEIAVLKLEIGICQC